MLPNFTTIIPRTGYAPIGQNYYMCKIIGSVGAI